MQLKPFSFYVLLVFLASCAGSKNYNPNKKYSKEVLREDYALLRNILERKHPALYWYTPKDSMDAYFEQYYGSIKDSMTEQYFGWKVVAPLLNKIRCGHTSFMMSKRYNRWADDKNFPGFPLYLKVWNDSMMVWGNQYRKDSLLKKGTFITSINGKKNKELIQTMFDHFATDGYSNSVNYYRLSNSFPAYHRNILGLRRVYPVTYIDSAGLEKSINLPIYEVKKDTSKPEKKKLSGPKPKRLTKAERKERYLLGLRRFEIDTANSTAVMVLNTFSEGKLRGFFRNSFAYAKENNIKNIVLDLRLNGGGKVILSNLLLKYLRKEKFRTADSCYAVERGLSPYTRHIQSGFWFGMGMRFLTRKSEDGNYHKRFRMIKPKRNNHFDGQLYILTSGPTFSASTLVTNALKGQENVTVVGEETGGGWYGNSGIFIPDITLPNSRLRVRLPLFKIVQFNHIAQKGTGVMPDVFVPTDYNALLNNEDKKMKVVLELIKQRKQSHLSAPTKP